MSSCNEVLKKAQKGLLFATPDHGCFINFRYDDPSKVPEIRDEVITKCRELLEYANKFDISHPNARTRIIIGFNPAHWKLWFPEITNLEQRPDEYLIDTSTKFLQTGGDIFFFIKSEDESNVHEIATLLVEKMKNLKEDPSVTYSSPSGKRILQRCFRDGLVNAADAETLCTYTIIPESLSTGMPGSCYMMTQKFEINWPVLGNMWNSEKEDMIGRRVMTDSFIPNVNERAHTFRAHFNPSPENPPQNMLNKHRIVFRQSLPYGVDPKVRGREEGIFYLSFANTTNTFRDILENLVGTDDVAGDGEVTVDLLLNTVRPLEGTWWYVPSAEELGVGVASSGNFEVNEYWNIRNPNNPYLFYNEKEYMYRMTSGGYVEPSEAPSSRVLRLLGYAFRQWNDQWFREREVPPIPHLENYLKPRRVETVMDSSVLIRKAKSVKAALSKVFTSIRTADMDSGEFYGNAADLFNIHPDEIIVGRMPNFGLGIGKVTMPYLKEGNERMDAFLKGLSENAAVGHVIPNIETILQRGVSGYIIELFEKLKTNGQENDFLRACIISLKGVRNYMSNYAALARHLADSQPEQRNPREYPFNDAQRENLRNISQRMASLAVGKPKSFVEAVQLVFTVHCCLHLTGDPTSIGRLDQMLEPFLGETPDDEAQEIIDCFFVKLGERVKVNKTKLVDRNTWGTTAVPYRSDGLFPNGDSINQWVQQLTVGGYKNTETGRVSACNKITMFCLKAARRLPLNAPCVSLRVHHGIGQEYLEEAAKAMLSGGAHPIILHDDRLLPGLEKVMSEFKTNATEEDLKALTNISCDGCYEPIVAGCTEFAFAYLPLLQVLEMTINEGATYSSAGPAYLNGTPQSVPTKSAVDIESFEELKEIFKYHFEIKTQQGLFGLLSNYGNIASVCPSPLLSSIIDGCVESGHDITDGGAKYKFIAMMYISFSSAVDSLYAIQRLCFDQDYAMLSLAEMVDCLKNDWGFDIHEPTHDRVAGEVRKNRKGEFYKQVREQALQFPKFGTAEAASNSKISDIAKFLADCVANSIKKVAKHPGSPLHNLLDSLKEKYSRPGHDFDLLLIPGSGTFEGYVGWGMSCGASADGRRRGAPIGSDMSAAPLPQDLPPSLSKSTGLLKAMQSWNMPELNIDVANGAEVDLAILESFSMNDLVEFLRKFSDEEGQLGGNIVTVTCANPETYTAAVADPEKYNLLRVREGGWSEYFITFFEAHQEQHRRRVRYYYDP